VSISTWFSVAGYFAMVTGIGVQFGVGWALLVGGGIAFVAGGLGSAREAR